MDVNAAGVAFAAGNHIGVAILVEGRIEAYDLGLPKDLNHEFASLEAEESVQKELDELKQRVSGNSEREAG